MINGTNYTDLLSFPLITIATSEMAAWVSTLFQELVIVFWTVSAVIVLFIYLRLFCAMRKIVRNNQANRIQQQQQQSATAFSREIRLLAYAIVIVLIQGLGATFSTLLIIYGFRWYRALETASDYNCYIHPYFLLILSAPLRDRCLSYLRVRKLQRGTTINLHSQAQLSPRIVASNSAAIIIA